MINPLELLATQLSLGGVVEIHTGTQGVSSEKYKLKTTTGTYFVKAISHTTDEQLRYVYDVERFMASKGIPVVPELTHTKALWLRLGDVAYKPSPFVSFDPKKKLEVSDFVHMGELLGNIHWASQKDAPARLFHRIIKPPTIEENMRMFARFRDLISKAETTGAREMLEYLDFKAARLPGISRGSIEVTDALIHGDYMPGNILIDVNGRIVAVCDWDHTRYGSRAFEIAYFIMFSCYHLRSERADALERARQFIRGYRSIYPIADAEILDGFDAYLYSIGSEFSLESAFLGQHRFDILAMIAHERSLIELVASSQFRSDIVG